ncbi:cytochrome c [Pseudomonas sp. AL 58]|uniref:cytochrome c n=1 Tax=Pseudomonas sp. AL 58 TaxID=3104275 RepID=UPI002EC0575B|nr:cytochrome c [Pseudomonas sp. AL 58]
MRRCLALLFAVLSLPLQAAQLVLELGDAPINWQTEDLLKHPQAQSISIAHDVSYKKAMHYRAIPLSALLTGVSAQDHLQAVALDGFAAEMPAAPLLAKGPARAWLAIEDPAKPWPGLGKGKPSAGPFYLVWTNPQAGHISPEQWPFQVASIRRLDAVAERFPAMRPAPGLADNSPVNLGFTVFQKNCLACHTLNGAGDAQFGPDLNLPYNPTEYFHLDHLRRYIRDPQSLRQWPQAKMPGFSSSVLSDGELDALLAYLQHMAGRKQP